jgi:hypothetical protein
MVEREEALREVKQAAEKVERLKAGLERKHALRAQYEKALREVDEGYSVVRNSYR